MEERIYRKKRILSASSTLSAKRLSLPNGTNLLYASPAAVYTFFVTVQQHRIYFVIGLLVYAHPRQQRNGAAKQLQFWGLYSVFVFG